MKVILFFIDGLGLGDNNKEINPYCLACTPFLDQLLAGHRLFRDTDPLCTGRAVFRGLDAALGVDGVPQSATGQTTVWTGINAARELGFHLHGLPNGKLKRIIRENNIYLRLKRLNKSVTFANAYRPRFFSGNSSHISVSTYAAQVSGLALRTLADLKAGNAVYQDITNKLLVERGYAVPLISPAAAAANLVSIIQHVDFTVFEYFQSDIAAHKRDWDRMIEIWGILDQFIAGVVKGINLEATVLIITSDHGNMEDLTNDGHTLNPVPLLAIGRGHQLFAEVNDLSGITPMVEKIFKEAD